MMLYRPCPPVPVHPGYKGQCSRVQGFGLIHPLTCKSVSYTTVEGA